MTELSYLLLHLDHKCQAYEMPVMNPIITNALKLEVNFSSNRSLANFCYNVGSKPSAPCWDCMNIKILLIITSLFSQTVFASDDWHQTVDLAIDTTKAIRNAGTLQTSCVGLIEPVYRPVTHCPWMLTQQIIKDREDGLLNESVHSKCGVRSIAFNERIINPLTGEKITRSITAERLETFLKSAKSTSLGAPEGKMVSTCLGPNSKLQSESDKIAVLSEYTLLRNRAAYGAQSLLQELYDIESTIPKSYENNGASLPWPSPPMQRGQPGFYEHLKKKSEIPGIRDLMMERDKCNSSMNLAQTRYKTKELRFKQSKVTLAQISIINKELNDIQSSLIGVNNSYPMSAYYVPTVRSLSKEQQARTDQLNAIKQTLLDSKPWLKTDEFKSLREKTNLHRTDAEGQPVRDAAGEIAWDFKNGEGEKIELAFHTQAQERRQFILKELRNIDSASSCLSGSSKTCDYEDVMKKLQSTPELAEESNLLRMDLRENSVDGSYRPDDITSAAIYELDTAASCREAFRGIHSEKNKIVRNFAIDASITIATAGVASAVAASARAGAAVTAVEVVNASDKLIKIVNATKKAGLAMRSLAASSAAQNIVKGIDIANKVRGLVEAINECDSKIVPVLEKDAIGKISCDEFQEKNLEAEHTSCLASVLMKAVDFAPAMMPAVIKKLANLTPEGEKLVKSWAALERLAGQNKSLKAYKLAKGIEGFLEVMEKTVNPKESTIKLISSLTEDGANEKISNSEVNQKIFKHIQESNDEKEKMELAKLLRNIDPSLEGLSDEEKAKLPY
jgi:hypothetical protein